MRARHLHRLQQLSTRIVSILVVVSMLLSSAPAATNALSAQADAPLAAEPVADAWDDVTEGIAETRTVGAAEAGSVDAGAIEPGATSQSILASPAQTFSTGESEGAAPGFDSDFVKHVEVGDGEYAAIISSAPLTYLDEDGERRPIDPRFESVGNSYTNRRNVLQIATGAHAPHLELATAQAAVKWQAEALALVDGTEFWTLAEPLETDIAASSLSDTGDTVYYWDSWTVSGIHDEVIARAGEAEHNVVFDRMPQLAEGAAPAADASLILRARLQLLPGSLLAVDGVAQREAFSTTGTIEIWDTEERAQLTLSPAWVYEQANPNNGILAVYHLKPQADGSWLVQMETPYAWWSDPDRAYPVVWDPAFAVLRPTHIVESRERANCVQNGNSSYLHYPGSVGIGINGTCGEVRTLVRFNNLNQISFPPGYTVEYAQLIIGATGGAFNMVNGTQMPANVTVNVRRITGAWTGGWPGAPTGGGILCNPYIVVPHPSSPFARPSVEQCELQRGANGMVTEWLNGQNNFGVMLAHGPNQPHGCDWQGCHLVTIPIQSSWSESSGGGLYYDYKLKGSGFALVIHYKGPKLQNGVPVISAMPNVAGQEYLRTYHSYEWGDSVLNRTWKAVAVKSVRPYTYDGQSIQVVAGQMGISDACNGRDRICSETLSPGGIGNQSNFILGQSGFGATGKEIRVYPLPAGSQATSYIMEAVGSEDAPPFPGEDYGEGVVEGTGVVTMVVTMSTDHILKVFNVNLPPNRRVAVMILDRSGPPIHLHMFKPRQQTYIKRESQNPIYQYGQRTYTVGSGDGGTWALVVEYPDSPGYIDEIGVLTEAEVEFIIRSCPLDAYPTADGCYFMQKPNFDPNEGPITESRTLGDYVIYSNNGFEPCQDAPANCEQTRRPTVGMKYMPWITWRGNTERMVGFAGQSIEIRYSGGTFGRELVGGFSRSTVLLALDPPREITKTLDMWTGGFVAIDEPDNRGYTRGFLYRGYYSENDCYYECANMPFDPAYYVDPYVTSLRLRIDLRHGDGFEQHADGVARITRPVRHRDNNLYNYEFEVRWKINIETSADGRIRPYDVTVTRLDAIGAGDVQIASMSLFWPADNSDATWDINFSNPQQRFTGLRALNARIQHQPKLGGAWNFVQGAIMPAGVAPDGTAGTCPGFCAGVFALDGSPEWKMPDVLVTGEAATMMIASEGRLEVFSKDHPLTPEQMEAVNAGFSFKTFNAKVQVREGVCPGTNSNNRVTIIQGETKIAFPGLGSQTDPSYGITANFTLCQQKLREVALTFEAQPGVPVAQPPVMYVHKLGGTVTIDPDHTTIEVEIGFYIGEPASPTKLYAGTATLTLDTRGLFDLQSDGRVMGIMDANGRLWVAWNPLDVGIGVSAFLPNEKDWLARGLIYAHVWRGRGWQGKYNWLPDDDAFHLTATYQVEFRIKEGQIFDWEFISLPPDDIEIGVELSFGQFCSNDDCTNFQWGIKGKVKIAGFNVGIYINLECDTLLTAALAPPLILLCTSFILGSDGYLLIDQYNGASPFPTTETGADETGTDGTGTEAEGDGAEALDVQPEASLPRVNGVVEEMAIQTVVDPTAPEVDQTFTVSATTGSLLVALGWAHGSPELALVRPDGVVLRRGTAATNGATLIIREHQMIYGVENPMPGEWRARITNIGARDDYQVLFLANKKVPEITFLAPVQTVDIEASGNGTEAQHYRIRWTPPDSSIDLRMGLYYSATNTLALTESHQVGGVIVENLDPSVGQYDWDLSYLASGDYHIYAVLQDARGSRASTLGRRQIPDVARFDAPGVIRYRDFRAPPRVPGNSVTYSRLEDGVKVCWDVSPAHDLSGYLFTYRRSDPYAGTRRFTERVIATQPYAPGAKECIRIGGLVPNVSQIDFPLANATGLAVYDASGNVSPYAAPPPSGIIAPGIEDYPRVGPLTATLQGTRNVRLNWDPVPNVARYEIFYARDTFAGPWQEGSGAQQGPAPISVDAAGFSGSYVVQNLPPGYWYAFAVRAISTRGYLAPGPLSNQAWVLVTSGADTNNDRVPDDWQAAHTKNSAPGQDPDRDSLLTRQEVNLGTNHLDPDTDDDGWTDGAEVRYGTNPLDPYDYPEITSDNFQDVYPNPALSLDRLHLSFNASVGGGNPPPQFVQITNTGGGTLTPSVSTNTPWLRVSIEDGKVRVGVRIQGLKAGHYTGRAQVVAEPTHTENRRQFIDVDLWIAISETVPPPPPPPPPALKSLFLPTIRTK